MLRSVFRPAPRANRGEVGGLAHGDPPAEHPALALGQGTVGRLPGGGAMRSMSVPRLLASPPGGEVGAQAPGEGALRCSMRLEREAGATAAGRGCVRIVDLERRADEFVRVVDL